MTPPACSFVSSVGTSTITGADTAVGALTWQPHHSSAARKRRPSRRCPISIWADASSSAAFCIDDGGSAGSSSSGSGGGAKDDGRAVSAEAAKAAAAAAVADMFLQLDASLDDDQLVVVGASASSGEVVLCCCQHVNIPGIMQHLLEPQSRFGDILLKFQVVCPQNGTAVL